MCDRGVVGAGVKTLSWPYAVTSNGGGRGRRRPPWRHHLFAAAPLLHGSGRRVLSRWNPSFCVPTMVAHWCVVFLLGGLVSELYISKRDRWFVAIVEFILLWQGWRWERCRWGSNGCSSRFFFGVSVVLPPFFGCCGVEAAGAEPSGIRAVGGPFDDLLRHQSCLDLFFRVLRQSRSCAILQHVAVFCPDLHGASRVRDDVDCVNNADGEVEVVCSEFRGGDDASSGGGFTMAHTCFLVGALFRALCMGFLMCAAQRLW